MKKRIALLFVSIIILIGLWWTFNFISHYGEFTKWGHASIGIENWEDHQPFYVGYPFKWEGIGKPTLEEIEFIKRDGTIVAKNDDEFKIQPFIARTGRIGALDEKGVKEDGLDDDLVSVKGYKVDGEFYLVLRVEFLGTNTNPINDISTLRITYEKFRTTQMQNIHFGEGLITDE
ncbi:hypothetical protein AWM68_02225 [Fictibacillus phosphorivorans]|uniref:Uncharacterized protein n=1 Tax=Fictibacillus phosphorivorans TaxID=1221500 RepID=A0A165P616_9BACL|nr:hypothetical protein [Fictibacillus phosphorivorans]KZE69103.1 hypothetical protein AWM68_02225 [Fictibacillus phosphorivorans]